MEKGADCLQRTDRCHCCHGEGDGVPETPCTLARIRCQSSAEGFVQLILKVNQTLAGQRSPLVFR